MQNKMMKTTPRIKIDCTEIIDGLLYLGSAKASKDALALQQIGITHILCLAGKAYHVGKFTYKVVHYKDSVDTELSQNQLDEMIQFIDDQFQNGGKVFVHCMGGMSRSPTVILVYLMRIKGMTLRDAYIHVRSRRKIHPNFGFQRQLVQIEKNLFGTSSVNESEQGFSII
jgi:protein-tyrosine phosphatase